MMLLLQREATVLQCLCCLLRSQVFKFPTCKDLKANAKTLPQSFDWAACFCRMINVEGQ